MHTEIDLGDIGEDREGIRIRRHPQALIAEAPIWLHEVWALFSRSIDRDLRLADVERLNARAVAAWHLMLGASRRRTKAAEAPRG